MNGKIDVSGGVELFIVQGDEYEVDPKTETGEYLDNVSTSLWMRKEEMEFPLYSHNEYGSWFSPMTSFSKNVNEDEVSEAFIEGVARIPSDEHGGWTGFEEDVWDEMSEVEQLLAHLIRKAVADGTEKNHPKYAVLEICQDKFHE